MVAFNSCIILASFILELLTKQSKAEYTCEIENYSPCTCKGIEGDGRNYILCNAEEVAVVMDVFNRTKTIELAEINIYQNWFENVIPDHLISNKKTGKLVFDCGYSPKTKIGKDSFNSTRADTTIVELYKCTLEDSDLSFIEGFTKMTSLLIDYFKGMGRLFSTFPTNLPTLNNIKLIECFGWNSLMNAPPPVVGARNFVRLDVIKSGDMTDDVMNVVIEWAIQSFNSTLKNLYIHSNNLTRIPSNIHLFGKIGTLDIKNNFISRIPAGSLKFTSNDLSFIDLSNCGIEYIEPNALEGRLQGTFIDMSNNFLTRLESSVFEEILLLGGTIDVFKNRFDCIEDPCHLAWIFNQNLLKSVFNAACSNGTFLTDLEPGFFVDCYIVSTLESSAPPWTTSIDTTQTTSGFSSFMTSINTWSITSSKSTVHQTSQGANNYRWCTEVEFVSYGFYHHSYVLLCRINETKPGKYNRNKPSYMIIPSYKKWPGNVMYCSPFIGATGSYLNDSTNYSKLNNRETYKLLLVFKLTDLLAILSLFVTFQVSLLLNRTIVAWSISIATGFDFHYWLVIITTRNEIYTSQKTTTVESNDVAVVPAINGYQDSITVVASPS